MTLRAWLYTLSVIFTGIVLTLYAVLHISPAMPQFDAFVVLTILATLSQFFEVEQSGHQSYYPHFVFFFAGALILQPFLFVLLLAIPHFVEWAKKRLEHSPFLRAWYLQPFNLATNIICGFAARWVYTRSMDSLDGMLHSPTRLLILILTILTYILLNHILIGLALSLARGVTLRKSGIMSLNSLQADAIMACLGYTVALLWDLDPWLIAPALVPLVLMYQALRVPQLMQDVQKDAKTGLLNATHFNTVFEMELERAIRFRRPLSVIMADLDLLRNINNTYGHLTGDVVLVGISKILRESVRKYDSVGRFGGEEFVILMPEATANEASEMAERIRNIIAATPFPASADSTPVSVTISMGVASFPEDARTTVALLHRADVAVYEAKRTGRNRVIRASTVPDSTIPVSDDKPALLSDAS